MRLNRSPSRVRAFRRATYHAAWAIPVGGVLALAIMQPAFLAHARNLLFDMYQRQRPRSWDVAAPVRIVDIDEESIARLGQWPWPRTRLATLVARLRDAKAAAIGFDIVFSEPDRTSPERLLDAVPPGAVHDRIKAMLGGIEGNDAVFAETLAGSPVALGLILTQDGGVPNGPTPYGFVVAGADPHGAIPQFSSVVAPLAVLGEKAAGLGFLNWLPDADQIVRRVPLVLETGSHPVPSLAMEMLRVGQGASTYTLRACGPNALTDTGCRSGVDAIRVGDIRAMPESDGAIRLHYSRHEAGRFVSAWQIMSGAFDASGIADRLVLVGSSAAGLNDVRATPLEAAVPGVEIQAQVLENLLTQAQLMRPDGALVLEIAAALGASLLLATILPLIPALAGGLAAAGLAASMAIASWIAFASYKTLFDPVMPIAMLGAVYLGSTAALFRAEQQGRRFVQDAFGRFVSPAIVARLADDPKKLVLGGEQRPLTIMFTDVRNFSAIAEGMEPSELTQFMNRYLSPMSEIVLEHGGTVDKYIGDAIMAFWNAPLSDAAHGLHAASAALAMIDSLPALNADLAAIFGAACPPIRCGIGLASGPCVVGNLGSRLRFDYSALGDDVNLASRLEGATKFYGVEILASEATRDLTPELAWLDVDRVAVVGRRDAARVFTLLGDAAHAQSSAFKALRETHEAMLAHYRNRRFTDAAHSIGWLQTNAPSSLTGLYALYAEWCGAYQMTPPENDWDGVTRLSQK